MEVASSKPGCTRCATRFFTSAVSKGCLGFTLLELAVVLAVVSILAVYALPSFNNFLARQRQITDINILVSSLTLARSEAIMRSSDVMVCKSSDGQLCTTNGEWSQGWIVFEDRDKSRSHESDEKVIFRQEQLDGIRLYYRAFGSNHYIVYRPQGMPKTNGTYTLCDTRGSSEPRALIVSKTGRLRPSTQRSNGDPLTCPP